MPPVHKLKTVPNPLKSILAIKALIFDKFLKIKCQKNNNYKYININKLSLRKIWSRKMDFILVKIL